MTETSSQKNSQPRLSKNPQLKLLKDQPKAYGGELLKTRQGRARGRPLDTKRTMHLVLRSSKATGAHSFWKPQNKEKIRSLVRKFSQRFGIKILSMANVGNHLHFHIKLTNRHTYAPFIRALTASIAMAITGLSRWSARDEKRSGGFWDYRPFTRVVVGLRAFLNLKDYIQINELEGFGFKREQAQFFLKWSQLKILEASG